MALLAWNDGLYTGITAADYEHRKLIDTVNRHHDAWVRSGRIGTGKLLDELLRLFSTHFVIEERLMTEIAYCDGARHEAHHREAIARLGDVCVKAAELGFDPSSDLRLGLQQWLQDHIRDHDVPLYRAVEAARKGARPATTRTGPPGPATPAQA